MIAARIEIRAVASDVCPHVWHTFDVDGVPIRSGSVPVGVGLISLVAWCADRAAIDYREFEWVRGAHELGLVWVGVRK